MKTEIMKMMKIIKEPIMIEIQKKTLMIEILKEAILIEILKKTLTVEIMKEAIMKEIIKNKDITLKRIIVKIVKLVLKDQENTDLLMIIFQIIYVKTKNKKIEIRILKMNYNLL